MKDNENFFLFHLESSFHIQDIPGYINTISNLKTEQKKKKVQYYVIIQKYTTTNNIIK